MFGSFNTRWVPGRLLYLALPLACLGTLGLWGCDSRSSLPVAVQPESLPVPAGNHARLAWLDDSLFFESSAPGDLTLYGTALWRFRLTDGHWEKLSLPSYPHCKATAYLAPERLPDGRLGYIASCKLYPEQQDELHMMADDLQTGRLVELLSYPLPTTQIGTGGYAWNPQMTRGLSGDGNGRYLNEQFYWFTPDHWEPLRLGFPVALAPSWSPDGQTIAFLAVPSSGLVGVSLDSEYNLFLMQPDGSQAHPLLTGLYHVNSLAWSPDNRWLLFQGETDGQLGLWLIDPHSGQHYLLVAGDFVSPVWSADGQEVAYIEYDANNIHSFLTHIWRVKVGALLQALSK